MKSPFTLAHGEIKPADMPTESQAASSVAAINEPRSIPGVAAVTDGSLSAAIELESMCWEVLKIMERTKYAEIKRLRAEIDAQRDKWAFYYGEVKRLRSANKASQQRA